MSLFWIISIVLLVLLLAVVVALGGLIVMALLPKELLQVGDLVDIFIDGKYDRTATITGVTTNCLYIYGTLPLPLNYRGKFYGHGTDIDGVDFWYLANRKHYYLVPFAEAIRRIYKSLSYPYNLCPVTSEADLILAAQEQREEAKKLEDNKENDSEEISEEGSDNESAS